MDTLKTILIDISSLQPHYSPDNTDKMQQRGHLIRNTLVDEIQSRKKILQSALGDFGMDFDVGASDGKGRKTEAPWVRSYSRSMSPSPPRVIILLFFSKMVAWYFLQLVVVQQFGKWFTRPIPRNQLQKGSRLLGNRL